MSGTPELLELFGALLVVVGLALLSVPLALVVTGLFFVAAGNTLPALPVRPRDGRSRAEAGR